VDGTAIAGIVTWSDLLKVPVTVLAFSLIAQLELAMSCRIKEEYGDRTSWLDLPEEKEKKQISRRLRTLQRENLVLPELDLADLGHKAKVLGSLLSAKGDFAKDLQNIVILRNNVAHVRDSPTENSNRLNTCSGGEQSANTPISPSAFAAPFPSWSATASSSLGTALRTASRLGRGGRKLD